MGRMIRKQVYIEPEQEELLKRRSKELGISEAALIRQAIDRLGAASDKPLPRKPAWEEAKRVIQERMQLPAWEDELAYIRYESCELNEVVGHQPLSQPDARPAGAGSLPWSLLRGRVREGAKTLPNQVRNFHNG